MAHLSSHTVLNLYDHMKIHGGQGETSRSQKELASLYSTTEYKINFTTAIYSFGLLGHLFYRWCLALLVWFHSQNSGMMLSLSSPASAQCSHSPSHKSHGMLGCHYHGIGVSHGSEVPSRDHQAGKVPGGALGHLRNCHWISCNTWS